MKELKWAQGTLGGNRSTSQVGASPIDPVRPAAVEDQSSIVSIQASPRRLPRTAPGDPLPQRVMGIEGRGHHRTMNDSLGGRVGWLDLDHRPWNTGAAFRLERWLRGPVFWYVKSPRDAGAFGGQTRVEGLEPSTAGFVDRCSIQLSYTRSFEVTDCSVRPRSPKAPAGPVLRHPSAG